MTRDIRAQDCTYWQVLHQINQRNLTLLCYYQVPFSSQLENCHDMVCDQSSTSDQEGRKIKEYQGSGEIMIQQQTSRGYTRSFDLTNQLTLDGFLLSSCGMFFLRHLLSILLPVGKIKLPVIGLSLTVAKTKPVRYSTYMEPEESVLIG